MNTMFRVKNIEGKRATVLMGDKPKILEYKGTKREGRVIQERINLGNRYYAEVKTTKRGERFITDFIGDEPLV